MIRDGVILLAAWCLASFPPLCIGGMLHDDCFDQQSSSHKHEHHDESAPHDHSCPEDPCSVAAINMSNPNQRDSDNLFDFPVVRLVPSPIAVVQSCMSDYCEPVDCDTARPVQLPFPASDIPLRI